MVMILSSSCCLLLVHLTIRTSIIGRMLLLYVALVGAATAAGMPEWLSFVAVTVFTLAAVVVSLPTSIQCLVACSLQWLCASQSFTPSGCFVIVVTQGGIGKVPAKPSGLPSHVLLGCRALRSVDATPFQTITLQLPSAISISDFNVHDSGLADIMRVVFDATDSMFGADCRLLTYGLQRGGQMCLWQWPRSAAGVLNMHVRSLRTCYHCVHQ